MMGAIDRRRKVTQFRVLIQTLKIRVRSNLFCLTEILESGCKASNVFYT